MNAIILLFLAGILLLGFEVFVPGGVLGTLGGLAMAIGCGVAFYQFGPATGTVATLIALALLGLAIWIELALIPRTRLGQRLLQRHAVHAQSQPPLADPQAVIGKTAETATPLAPSGYVLIDGSRYEAWSETGYVPKGRIVRVTGLDAFRLIVSEP